MLLFHGLELNINKVFNAESTIEQHYQHHCEITSPANGRTPTAARLDEVLAEGYDSSLAIADDLPEDDSEE